MIRHVRTGLAVLVILITSWLGWGLYSAINDIRHALSDEANDFRDNSEFYLSQYERELTRLIIAVQDYHAGDSTVSRQDLIHYLDIFWSRVNVYDQGAMGQYVAAITNDNALKTDSIAILEQTESILMNSPGRNPSVGILIITPLKKLLDRYHDVILHVNGSTISYKSKNRAFLADWLEQSVFGIAGLVAAIGLLVAFLYIDLVATTRQVQETLKAQLDAEEANRVKSEFLSSMSHEIRTPMTGVIGFADMLMDEDLPESSRDKVASIKQATRSLLRLLNDILDMSRLEAGKMEIEYIDFSLADWMQDIMALFTGEALAGETVALSLEMNSDLPTWVNSDPTRLRQILVNIVGNAMKFTHEGKVVVRCINHRFPNGDTGLRFEVEDTGIGMREETINNLFGDFFQADASISRRYEGSGLGLAICRRLTGLLGGEISVESTVGVGTLFWVQIPCKAAISAQDEGQSGEAGEGKIRASRPLSILVAEDNRVNQIILDKFLTAWGHSVSIAVNGVEAVQQVQQNKFDLVLMDIRMPEMNGVDATRQIRQLEDTCSAIPIIAVTADAMADQIPVYRDAGMNDCVTKPVNRTRLAASIDQVLGENLHLSS